MQKLKDLWSFIAAARSLMYSEGFAITQSVILNRYKEPTRLFRIVVRIENKFNNVLT